MLKALSEMAKETWRHTWDDPRAAGRASPTGLARVEVLDLRDDHLTVQPALWRAEEDRPPEVQVVEVSVGASFDWHAHLARVLAAIRTGGPGLLTSPADFLLLGRPTDLPPRPSRTHDRPRADFTADRPVRFEVSVSVTATTDGAAESATVTSSVTTPGFDAPLPLHLEPRDTRVDPTFDCARFAEEVRDLLIAALSPRRALPAVDDPARVLTDRIGQQRRGRHQPAHVAEELARLASNLVCIAPVDQGPTVLVRWAGDELRLASTWSRAFADAGCPTPGPAARDEALAEWFVRLKSLALGGAFVKKLRTGLGLSVLDSLFPGRVGKRVSWTVLQDLVLALIEGPLQRLQRARPRSATEWEELLVDVAAQWQEGEPPLDGTSRWLFCRLRGEASHSEEVLRLVGRWAHRTLFEAGRLDDEPAQVNGDQVGWATVRVLLAARLPRWPQPLYFVYRALSDASDGEVAGGARASLEELKRFELDGYDAGTWPIPSRRSGPFLRRLLHEPPSPVRDFLFHAARPPAPRPRSVLDLSWAQLVDLSLSLGAAERRPRRGDSRTAARDRAARPPLIGGIEDVAAWHWLSSDEGETEES